MSAVDAPRPIKNKPTLMVSLMADAPVRVACGLHDVRASTEGTLDRFRSKDRKNRGQFCSFTQRSRSFTVIGRLTSAIHERSEIGAFERRPHATKSASATRKKLNGVFAASPRER